MPVLQVNVGSTTGVVLALLSGYFIQHHFTDVDDTINQNVKVDELPVLDQFPPTRHYQQTTPPIQSVIRRTNYRENGRGASLAASTSEPEMTKRPIIGILAQNCILKYEDFGEQVVFPNNVRWMEASGARVLPIWANKSEDYYEKMVQQINGLYIPGGHSTHINSTYFRSARILLNLAIKENERGVHFPIWGVCLGLQFFFSNIVNQDVTYNCPGQMYRKTQHYRGKEFEGSFLDEFLSPEGLSALEERRYMPHMHKRCVSMRTYNSNPEFQKQFKVVSVNADDNGVEYISTIQSRKYPFYATQWHPEKFSYHFNMRAGTAHTSSAIQLGHEIGNFIVAESRKNNHEFIDKADEEALLIDNYNIVIFGYPDYATFYFFSNEDITDEGLQKRKEKLSALRNQKVSMNGGKLKK